MIFTASQLQECADKISVIFAEDSRFDYEMLSVRQVCLMVIGLHHVNNSDMPSSENMLYINHLIDMQKQLNGNTKDAF